MSQLSLSNFNRKSLLSQPGQKQVRECLNKKLGQKLEACQKLEVQWRVTRDSYLLSYPACRQKLSS